VENLVTGELGIDVLRYQIKYLRKNKKPANMTVHKWFKRIRFINRMLLFLSGGTKAKDDTYLLENLVVENISFDWNAQC